MTMAREHDVAIVGAGPVGLVLALLLGRHGIDVGVYERWHKPYGLPRAVGLSHDAVRVLQSTGVLPQLVDHMDFDFKKSAGEYFDQDGEVILSFEFPGMGESGFPSMVPFDQPSFETALLAAADADPRITIHRGWSATTLHEVGDRVDLDLAPLGGDGSAAGPPLRVSARYVIGCDGANSTIRALIGAEIVETGFHSTWMVVDIRPDAALQAKLRFGQSLDHRRPTTIVPAGPNRRRFEFMALPGETSDQLTRPETVWALLQPWGVTPDNAELVRQSVYNFTGRWVQNWRDGRVLLAGDAAHQMPPFMAQGFNSGMRDAAALAWRLALVCKGIADDTILDSYSSERMPHAATIVQQAVGAGHMICILDEQAALGRNAQLRAMRNDPNAPSMLVPWELGPGIARAGDPAAHRLGLQARVTRDGKTGLLDDLVPPGHFSLLSRVADPLAGLSQAAKAAWQRIGGQAVVLGVDAIDVDGTYAAWFDSLAADIVVVRPDFYVFGAGRASEADEIILALAAQLTLAPADAPVAG